MINNNLQLTAKDLLQAKNILRLLQSNYNDLECEEVEEIQNTINIINDSLEK